MNLFRVESSTVVDLQGPELVTFYERSVLVARPSSRFLDKLCMVGPHFYCSYLLDSRPYHGL